MDLQNAPAENAKRIEFHAKQRKNKAGTKKSRAVDGTTKESSHQAVLKGVGCELLKWYSATEAVDRDPYPLAY